MSKFDCVLCGRDITDDGASFSSYLDGVKESRCPECGGAQGVDIEGLRSEVNALRAENERLRAELDEALRLLATRVEAKRLDDACAEVAALRETLKSVKEATLDYVTFHGPSCEWHYDEPEDSCRACLIDKRMNAACAILEGK